MTPQRYWHSIGLLAVFLAGSAQANSGAVPQQFEAQIGGFFDGRTHVVLKGTRLEYTRYTATQQLIEHSQITPTAAQWRQFRQALQQAGVCSWQARYANNQVLDGTQWQLRWHDGHCEVNASGSNSYPDTQGRDNQKPEPTPAFTHYLHAIETLLGQQPNRLFR